MDMTLLKICPGQKPELVSMPNTLDALQEAVGGSIQAIYPYDDPVALICNEEGKLLGLEPNRALHCEETGEIYDILCGTFLICGLGSEDFTSLTKPLAEKYARKFQSPELLLWNGQRLVIIPL